MPIFRWNNENSEKSAFGAQGANALYNKVHCSAWLQNGKTNKKMNKKIHEKVMPKWYNDGGENELNRWCVHMRVQVTESNSISVSFVENCLTRIRWQPQSKNTPTHKEKEFVFVFVRERDRMVQCNNKVKTTLNWCIFHIQRFNFSNDTTTAKQQPTNDREMKSKLWNK